MSSNNNMMKIINFSKYHDLLRSRENNHRRIEGRHSGIITWVIGALVLRFSGILWVSFSTLDQKMLLIF